jgi:hypothetical protein
VASGSRELTAIFGRVDGIKSRFVTLERYRDGRWTKIVKVPLQLRNRTGSYRFHVSDPGRYRIRAGWAPGPAIRVR